MTALLIDFGSTYTKLRAVALDPPRLIGTAQGPSTVTTDINTGLDQALAELERSLGALPNFRYRLASSSAAGGLRMVTIGLVRELTLEAARRAALGAGARLVGTFAQKLNQSDIANIEALAPDIIMLAGGTDGGNSEVILHNATLLAECEGVQCPIIVAGNRAAADRVNNVLCSAGKPVMVCDNVLPELGQLSIEPARAMIRRIFIERIVHAKGIDRAAGRFDAVLMPTPAAVLEGARLLSDGTDSARGIGDLVVVDVGGATTDVHSVAVGDPTRSGVIVRGLPEPRVKRTVEGDLGMRHNAHAIAEQAGLDALSRISGLPRNRVENIVERFAAYAEALPGSRDETAVETALAQSAVRLAVERHAGTIETVYTATGPATVQTGKDLGAVPVVIGTGGPLVHSPEPRRILAASLADPADSLSLRPRNARLLLDRHYMLYAAGLLSAVEPDAAFRLMNETLDVPTEDLNHGRTTVQN